MIGWVGVVDLEVKGVWNAPMRAHILFQIYLSSLPFDGRSRQHGHYDLRYYDGRDRRSWKFGTGGHIINCVPYHRGWFNSAHNELFVRAREYASIVHSMIRHDVDRFSIATVRRRRGNFPRSSCDRVSIRIMSDSGLGRPAAYRTAVAARSIDRSLCIYGTKYAT